MMMHLTLAVCLQIHFEDFRMFGESFGMQLDDDSLLALYYVYDPHGTGYLAYEDVMKQLLDKDYYAMYSPAGVDNTQVSCSCIGVCLQVIAHQVIIPRDRFAGSNDQLWLLQRGIAGANCNSSV